MNTAKGVTRVTKKYDLHFLTNDEIISLAKEIHEDKYIYISIDFEYKGKQRHKIITYKCKQCGHVTKQVIGAHVTHKHGCYNCKSVGKTYKPRINFNSMTKKQIFEFLAEKHNNKYVYLDIYDRNGDRYIKYRCNRCNNIIEQMFYNHASGNSCNICRRKFGWVKELSNEQEFDRAKKIHNDRYEYLDIFRETKHNNKVVKFRCKKCDKIISHQLQYHLRGNGCKQCYSKVNVI